ncbi:MFS transporter [Brevibacillus gelatini]
MKKLFLLSVLVSLFTVMQDGTLLYVLLPQIQEQFATSLSTSIWIMNLYILPFALLMIVMGRVADRYGHIQVFLIGLAIYTAGSFLGYFSNSFPLLLGSRFIQGIGSSILVPVSLVILLKRFGKKRYGQAIGSWSATCALAAACGPISAGVIGHFASWRFTFLANGTLVLLALLALIASLKSSPVPDEERDTQVVPMPNLWKESETYLFLIGNFFAGFILNSLLYVLPFMLGNFLDYDSLQIAYTVTPLCASMIVSVGIAGRLERKMPLEFVISTGFFGLLASLCLYMLREVPLYVYMGASFLAGLGLGIVIISITSAWMKKFTYDHLGLGSAILNMLRLVGAVIGSSLSASLFRRMVDTSLHTGGVPANEWLASLKASGEPIAQMVWANGFSQVVVGVFAVLSLVPVAMIVWYIARYGWRRKQQNQASPVQDG